MNYGTFLQDTKTLLCHLIEYGTTKPLYYPSLLEILIAVFPEPLPLLITEEEKDEVEDCLESHRLEVERLRKSFNWKENRNFGEVPPRICIKTDQLQMLLCSTPYIKTLVEEFFKRVAKYQNDEFMTSLVRLVALFEKG